MGVGSGSDYSDEIATPVRSSISKIRPKSSVKQNSSWMNEGGSCSSDENFEDNDDVGGRSASKPLTKKPQSGTGLIHTMDIPVS